MRFFAFFVRVALGLIVMAIVLFSLYGVGSLADLIYKMAGFIYAPDITTVPAAIFHGFTFALVCSVIATIAWVVAGEMRFFAWSDESYATRAALGLSVVMLGLSFLYVEGLLVAWAGDVVLADVGFWWLVVHGLIFDCTLAIIALVIWVIVNALVAAAHRISGATLRFFAPRPATLSRTESDETHNQTDVPASAPLKVAMTADEAIALADEWARNHTFHEGSQGWRVAAKVLADEVRRLRRGEFICQRCSLRKDSEHTTECPF